jgi:MFS family permease
LCSGPFTCGEELVRIYDINTTEGPYIAAYLKQYDESVTLSTMSLVFPILGLAMFSMLSFGVKLAQRIGFKVTIFFTGLFISLAFLICSFLKTFAGFIIIYCFMVGISSGLAYMLPIRRNAVKSNFF